MPKFELNKLVRDGLKGEYERDGQKPTYRELSPSDHKKELIGKIIEEALEIQLDNYKEVNLGELADIQQALKDLSELFGITSEQIEDIRRSKFDKKGGFLDGVFVETIELSDQDEWVKYYRQNPERFKEIK